LWWKAVRSARFPLGRSMSSIPSNVPPHSKRRSSISISDRRSGEKDRD
jgi:hypothetical protein